VFQETHFLVRSLNSAGSLRPAHSRTYKFNRDKHGNNRGGRQSFGANDLGGNANMDVYDMPQCRCRHYSRGKDCDQPSYSKYDNWIHRNY